CRSVASEKIENRLTVVRRTSTDIDQTSHPRMVARFTDHHTTPRMTHQDHGLILHLKGAMDRLHIIGERAEGVLHGNRFQTAFRQKRDHFPPGRAVGKSTVDEDYGVDGHDDLQTLRSTIYDVESTIRLDKDMGSRCEN